MVFDMLALDSVGTTGVIFSEMDQQVDTHVLTAACFLWIHITRVSVPETIWFRTSSCHLFIFIEKYMSFFFESELFFIDITK